MRLSHFQPRQEMESELAAFRFASPILLTMGLDALGNIVRRLLAKDSGGKRGTAGSWHFGGLWGTGLQDPGSAVRSTYTRLCEWAQNVVQATVSNGGKHGTPGMVFGRLLGALCA